jgi:hypothetical protein
MRNILLINAAILLFASTAFAGATITMSSDLSATSAVTGKTLYGAKTAGAAATADENQKLIGKASTGVAVGCITSTLGYAIVTQHKQGVKAYGTSHDSTAVYMADAEKGTAKLTVPSAIGTTDFVASGSGWTSM